MNPENLFQRTILLAQKHIELRPDRGDSPYERATVMATRDCLVAMLNIIRAQFGPALSTPPEAVALLLAANAQLLYGLEMNPFWQQHKQFMIIPLQMVTNAAEDAIEAMKIGDPEVVKEFLGTCGHFVCTIVNLHAGYAEMRRRSAQIRKDVAELYG